MPNDQDPIPSHRRRANPPVPAVTTTTPIVTAAPVASPAKGKTEVGADEATQQEEK